MSDLESMSDDTWPTLLQHVLEYVTLLTNLEGSALSAPTLTRKEIIEHDTTSKESRAAAIAAAAAAEGGEPFVGRFIPGTIAMVALGMKHSDYPHLFAH